MSELLRLRVAVQGAVQGVGFRPFVYRLATEAGLSGWVLNSVQGVLIEVEGKESALRALLNELQDCPPPRAFIQSLEHWWLDSVGYQGFEIRQSNEGGNKSVFVLPDIATCEACRRDIIEPGNRRFRYPFTNCTNCGPRYSIIESLPYDRANTTMRDFEMCPDCRREYEDPTDRRFHAQPNACPVCGPQVALWTHDGSELANACAAVIAGAEAVSNGKIVAVKGLGGFHLIVDARDEGAVRLLRERKHREHKPLALMVRNLEQAEELCEVGELEARALLSPEAPIVLMRARGGGIAPAVAPGNPYLGVMLPYTPLHHLLMRMIDAPVVATSGNLSDEPMCIDEREALVRLGDIADQFLVHDRPIRRHVDDSIVRVVAGREMVVRRARGFAPLPVPLVSDEERGTSGEGLGDRDEGRGTSGEESGDRDDGSGFGVRGSVACDPEGPSIEKTRAVAPVGEGISAAASGISSLVPRPSSLHCLLAVGAHLKNSVALTLGNQAFLSQHIGDLETPQALDAFEQVIADLGALYEATPEAVACDLHPDYLSTQYARKSELPRIEVQHHLAHVLACMADNDLRGEVLGVSWDGTGLGDDGTIWGGEFIRVDDAEWERVAHLRTFSLPGGDGAAREPRRSAMGLLREIGATAPWALAEYFEEPEQRVVLEMLRAGANCPRTSSAGRLFDAVSALAGVCGKSRFEGEAAMMLEFAAGNAGNEPPYAIKYDPGAGVLDWAPTIAEILDDVANRAPTSCISARFHGALAEGIVQAALSVGVDRVLLTGGCFQNRLLLETTVENLKRAGLRPYWHQRVPTNDGGIALGQAAAAAHPRARRNRDYVSGHTGKS
jgi:hydrogenase maturation protein HypF